MTPVISLTDAALRQQAYEWCGKNQTTYSEWTIDELTSAFIALRDAARAEQREQFLFAWQTTEALVCPQDRHTLGCKCSCVTCVQRERGAEVLRAQEASRE